MPVTLINSQTSDSGMFSLPFEVPPWGWRQMPRPLAPRSRSKQQCQESFPRHVQLPCDRPGSPPMRRLHAPPPTTLAADRTREPEVSHAPSGTLAPRTKERLECSHSSLRLV